MGVAVLQRLCRVHHTILLRSCPILIGVDVLRAHRTRAAGLLRAGPQSKGLGLPRMALGASECTNQSQQRCAQAADHDARAHFAWSTSFRGHCIVRPLLPEHRLPCQLMVVPRGIAACNHGRCRAVAEVVEGFLQLMSFPGRCLTGLVQAFFKLVSFHLCHLVDVEVLQVLFQLRRETTRGVPCCWYHWLWRPLEHRRLGQRWHVPRCSWK
mmetsp:Transcript_150712/g.420095  ORF Transcript_150712/g.420095 Transcript_150712/m.420095 type:complete len:211 (-) Transcript_150712:830-1462(-)